MFNWEWKGLEQVMDWITVSGVVAAVVLLIIEIIRAAREKNSLSKEHTGLSKEHTGLSKEHTEIKEALTKEHQVLKDSLKQDNKFVSDTAKTILSKVYSIDKFIAVEATKRENTANNLTDRQRDIKNHVEAIECMLHEMEELQNRLVEVEHENQLLKNKVFSLETTLGNEQAYENGFEPQL